MCEKMVATRWNARTHSIHQLISTAINKPKQRKKTSEKPTKAKSIAFPHLPGAGVGMSCLLATLLFLILFA